MRVSSEAENAEPQPHSKRGRLTTLDDTNEAENGEKTPKNNIARKGGSLEMPDIRREPRVNAADRMYNRRFHADGRSGACKQQLIFLWRMKK